MRWIVGGFTREALAERAGVRVGYVDRLIELGILAPPETGSLFSVSEGDVRRSRLVQGLEEGCGRIPGGMPARVASARADLSPAATENRRRANGASEP